MHAKQAEQLYTLADLSRLLKLQPERVNELMGTGEILPADMFIPGGGHKGRRWSASRVIEIQQRLKITAAA